MDNGYGQRIPVSLTVSLFVSSRLFFGHLPIQRLSGFKDELSGAIITNAFTTGIFDPEEVINAWQAIAKEADRSCTAGVPLDWTSCMEPAAGTFSLLDT